MYVRVKREKLVGATVMLLACMEAMRPCNADAALAAALPSICPTPLACLLRPDRVQTVFLNVEPTDQVSSLKQKLQELLQQVGVDAPPDACTVLDPFLPPL